MGMSVRAEGLFFGYGARGVLHGVSFDALLPGQIAAVVGPNGTGKTTLFKCLAGLLAPQGTVRLDGRAARTPRRARRLPGVTYLPQEFPVATALTVFESVLVAGRGGGWRVTADQAAHAASVLRRLGVEHLSDCYLTELSGGQRQLVSVAQALARRPDVLLLDEPSSSLDLRHQLQLLAQVRAITVDEQMTTAIAIHDLNLAARFADRIIVLHRGRLVADGTPRGVLTARLLRDVYRIDAAVEIADGGTPVVIPRRALPLDGPPETAEQSGRSAADSNPGRRMISA